MDDVSHCTPMFQLLVQVLIPSISCISMSLLIVDVGCYICDDCICYVLCCAL